MVIEDVEVTYDIEVVGYVPRRGGYLIQEAPVNPEIEKGAQIKRHPKSMFTGPIADYLAGKQMQEGAFPDTRHGMDKITRDHTSQPHSLGPRDVTLIPNSTHCCISIKGSGEACFRDHNSCAGVVIEDVEVTYDIEILGYAPRSGGCLAQDAIVRSFREVELEHELALTQVDTKLRDTVISDFRAAIESINVTYDLVIQGYVPRGWNPTQWTKSFESADAYGFI